MSLTPTPSELRVTTVSIDSRFADQIYGTTADYMIRLPATMRNVGRVGLTSVEIPQVVYVFSAGVNTNFSVLDSSGVTTALTIPSGNYTGPELAAAVTAAMAPDVSGSCVYDAIGNRFSFINTGSTAYTVNLQSSDAVVAARHRDWGIGYNLGFRTLSVTVGAGSTVTGTASPSLLPPAYMLLQLQCPDMMENTLHRLADGSFVQALAKLVLRPGPAYVDSGFYQVQYDDQRNGLRKENVFVRPTSIAQLRIRLLDAYGSVVEMGDTDWSATLEFTEVVSAGHYSALNRAMPGRG